MGDPMAPSGSEGNSEGEVHEQAGRLWNERNDTNDPLKEYGCGQGLVMG